jgi:putative hydrolase of the HAD superfamily
MMEHRGLILIETIGFDGDDTLWHNENLFHSTQEQLRVLLGRYSSGQHIQKRLLDVEMRNMRCYGYGAKGFILSMIETAIEISNHKVTCEDIQEIINMGKEMIHQPVHLIEGARDTLEHLQTLYRLILITKGELIHQEAKVAQSGIGDLFQAVEIVSEKDTLTYQRILTNHELSPDDFLMVGNSLRSDALPVLELGGRAVIIPYRLIWKHEEMELGELPGDRFWEIKSIADLPSKLREIDPRSS